MALNPQLTPDDPQEPVAVKPTAELNPLSEVTEIELWAFPDWPAGRLTDEGESEIVKSAVPVQLVNFSEPIAVCQT